MNITSLFATEGPESPLKLHHNITSVCYYWILASTVLTLFLLRFSSTVQIDLNSAMLNSAVFFLSKFCRTKLCWPWKTVSPSNKLFIFTISTAVILFLQYNFDTISAVLFVYVAVL